MSVMKIVKANLITQVIWFVVIAVMAMVAGIFKTSASAQKNAKKTTKDGFQSEKMQNIYNNYVEKEMGYGKN